MVGIVPEVVVQRRAGAATDVPRIRHLGVVLLFGTMTLLVAVELGGPGGAIARAADRLGGEAGRLVLGFAGRFGCGLFLSRGLSWRWVGGND
jgi:hypothetical protein